jgi:hypothetical protein
MKYYKYYYYQEIIFQINQFEFIYFFLVMDIFKIILDFIHLYLLHIFDYFFIHSILFLFIIMLFFHLHYQNNNYYIHLFF